MNLVAEIAKSEKYPQEVKDSFQVGIKHFPLLVKSKDSVRSFFQTLLDARSNGTWGSEGFVPALPAGSREASKPRSNAITIEVLLTKQIFPNKCTKTYFTAWPQRRPLEQQQRCNQQQRKKQSTQPRLRSGHGTNWRRARFYERAHGRWQ